MDSRFLSYKDFLHWNVKMELPVLSSNTYPLSIVDSNEIYPSLTRSLDMGYEYNIFSPHILSPFIEVFVFSLLIKNTIFFIWWIAVCFWSYFWTLYNILLVSLSNDEPVPHCLKCSGYYVYVFIKYRVVVPPHCPSPPPVFLPIFDNFSV